MPLTWKAIDKVKPPTDMEVLAINPKGQMLIGYCSKIAKNWTCSHDGTFIQGVTLFIPYTELLEEAGKNSDLIEK